MNHEYYMNLALQEAHKAAELGEIPVGALVVVQGHIIAKAHNQSEQLMDVTAHAEILALTAASNYLGSKYLAQCTMYVTLEPCVMCAGALAWAQLGSLVYGASDPKRGFSSYTLQNEKRNLLHPKTQILTGVLESECQAILQTFFERLRKLN